MDTIMFRRQVVRAYFSPDPTTHLQQHLLQLEVDGGINGQTAALAVKAGADVLVAGTAAFAGGPARYRDNLAKLRGG
jgi:pentose-5-phosphate-3-epimerase